jgi:hypothetical protein
MEEEEQPFRAITGDDLCREAHGYFFSGSKCSERELMQ